MKTIKTFLLVLTAAFMVSGCDFFRSLVGRPTSAELDALRMEAAAKAERQRQVEDSLKAVAMAAGQMAEDQTSVESLEPVTDADLRYQVVLGSFKVPENAERFINLLKEKGYTPKSLKFRNGYNVISAYRSDDFYQAVKVMNETMEYDFCPEDVWIYDLKQQLHE